MESSVSFFVAEIKRRLASQLPVGPPIGGGMHHIVARTAFALPSDSTLRFEVFETLLLELADDYPYWETELTGGTGEPFEVTVTLTR